ncbi:hypothetical protein BDV37DRAFT_267401 [Aspergillus pseudonomiae]|uniref:Zn(2)-C6 fungal-type domain-containing protein n=1 Tax=Aspergillus pseudonomiae TaxID=1506151 RepID=A0A5N7CRE2_9EURO|nr:uncharacterized protein BDV37DRAFT_267401 [Aspergillus pseudonomiae]KAE8396771.1 hypothetical protein BDV37DRAFT_267401 [Aspergillus pseudonomiae]
MSRNTGNSARLLLPKNSIQEDPQRDSNLGTVLKRRRQTTACTTCQRKRTKCTGTTPCQGCTASGSECVFDFSKDKRRKETLLKAQRDALDTYQILLQLVRILYDGTDETVKKLRGNIQGVPSLQEAMVNLRSLFP